MLALSSSHFDPKQLPQTPALIPANVAYEYFNVTPDGDAQQIGLQRDERFFLLGSDRVRIVTVNCG
jgi:hypothetical protein